MSDLEIYLNQYSLEELSQILIEDGFEVEDNTPKDDIIYTIELYKKDIQSPYLLHFKYKKIFNLEEIIEAINIRGYKKADRYFFRSTKQRNEIITPVGTRESSPRRSKRIETKSKVGNKSIYRKDKIITDESTKPKDVTNAIKRSETDIRKIFDFREGKSICNYTADLTTKLPVLGKGVSGIAYKLTTDTIFKTENNLSLVIKEVSISKSKIDKSLIKYNDEYGNTYSTTKQINEILAASILSELYTNKICINFSYYQSFIMCPEEDTDDITGYLLVEEMSITMKDIVKYYVYREDKPNLEDYGIDFYVDIKMLVFQFLCSFELMQYYYGAVHYDFHPDNMFIKLLDDKNIITNGVYNIHETYYKLDDIYLLAKIADLDTVSMWGGKKSDDIIIPSKYIDREYDEEYGHDSNFKPGYDLLMMIQNLFWVYKQFRRQGIHEIAQSIEPILFDLVYNTSVILGLIDESDYNNEELIVKKFLSIFNDKGRPLDPHYYNIEPLDLIECGIFDDYIVKRKPRIHTMLGTTEA